jgi:hypothetical protein
MCFVLLLAEVLEGTHMCQVLCFSRSEQALHSSSTSSQQGLAAPHLAYSRGAPCSSPSSPCK